MTDRTQGRGAGRGAGKDARGGGKKPTGGKGPRTSGGTPRSGDGGKRTWAPRGDAARSSSDDTARPKRRASPSKMRDDRQDRPRPSATKRDQDRAPRGEGRFDKRASHAPDDAAGKGAARPFKSVDRPFGKDRRGSRVEAEHSAPRQGAPTKRYSAKATSGDARQDRPRSSTRSDDARAPRSDERFDKRASHAPYRGASEGAARTSKPGARRAAAERPIPADAVGEAGGARIAKLMARAGLCSRRDAELWIAEGRVAVNGLVLTGPARNVGPSDHVVVDGQELPAAERTRLFMFHKPRGFVTTDRDPDGRATIFDHLRAVAPDLPRLVSVGRLDINTEGLLLLTNDGGLARVLELPSTGWLRRYRVRANGAVDQNALTALRDGITIDGISYVGIEATLDRVQGANAWMTIGLREGKNREIKRILEHLGLAVNRLIRMSFGPFQLNDLPEGAVEEVRTRVLRDQLGTALAEAADADFDSPTMAERAAAAPRPRPTRERAPGGREEHPSRGRDERPARRAERVPRGRDDGRSRAAEAAPPPERGRPQKGTRPHVATARAAADSERRTGPRIKVTRGETADRKGRAVAVERVSKSVKPAGPSGSRNARRFDAERGDGTRRDTPRSAAPKTRGPRPPAGGGDRPPRRR